MSEQSYAAVILAAGRSSRMGRPKALMELGGRTALARLVGLYREAGIARQVVVTGRWAEQIGPAARELGAEVIHNPDFESGMFSSILTGLKAASRAGAVFIHPVDIPLVSPDTVKSLIQAFETGQGDLIRPSINMRLGHPPLLGRAVIPEILNWPGGNGLKGALAALKEKTGYLVVKDEAIMWDMDTREDWQRLDGLARQREAG